MDAVLRGTAIYVFMMGVFRFAGRRTLSEITNFDFVLLLIVAEATQQALLGEDFSLTNAFLVVITLVGIDIFLSVLKDRFPRLERAIEGMPVILENGQPLKDRMKRARVDQSDILEAARESQGLERLEQIKYAVLESTGSISIIPKSTAYPAGGRYMSTSVRGFAATKPNCLYNASIPPAAISISPNP